MNWRSLYLSLISTQIVFSVYLITLLVYLFPYNGIEYVYLVLIGCCFWYTYELNRVITHKKNSTKKLRVLEYICYVVIFLFIARLGLIVYTGLTIPDEIYEFYGNSLLNKILTSIFIEALFLVLLVIFSIAVFIKRKKVLGTYDFSVTKEQLNLATLQLKSFQTQEERIAVCLSCTHRKLDTATGMICGLTNEKPTFTAFCDDYNEDEKATAKIHELQTEEVAKGFWGSWMSALLLAVLGFIRAALKGLDDPFGIIFLALGIIWLFIAIFSPKK